MKSKLYSINFRIPVELHKKVRAMADIEFRSINSMLIALLKEALDAREKMPK
jgi:hypothetical protein